MANGCCSSDIFAFVRNCYLHIHLFPRQAGGLYYSFMHDRHFDCSLNFCFPRTSFTAKDSQRDLYVGTAKFWKSKFWIVVMTATHIIPLKQEYFSPTAKRWVCFLFAGSVKYRSTKRLGMTVIKSADFK